jgi:hypothetical protein
LNKYHHHRWHNQRRYPRNRRVLAQGGTFLFGSFHDAPVVSKFNQGGGVCALTLVVIHPRCVRFIPGNGWMHALQDPAVLGGKSVYFSPAVTRSQ